MNHKHHRQVSLALVLCLIASACAPKNPPAPGTVAPRTPLAWTIVFNASLAKANLALEKEVIGLQMNKVISADQARPILEVVAKVATTGKAVVGITSNATEASWSVDGPKVRALLASVSVDLPQGGVANAALDIAISTVQAALLLLKQEVAK